MKKKIRKLFKGIFKKTPEVAVPGQGDPDPQAMVALYERYRVKAHKKIQLGKAGKLKLTPKDLWLNISENCNLRCVGCYTPGRFKKIYASVEDVRKAIQFNGHVEQIKFITNESLLNPHFCEIIDLCRDMHPNAKLLTFTNGTIPMRGRYREAISKVDKVGLSIDGATRETFEKIRIGARFDDFIKNTQDILRIRDETGSPREIIFAFTATATNLHELIDVVRLAHQLGLTRVHAQSMEAKDDVISERIAEILIDRLDPMLRTRLINQAKQEAARLKIGLTCQEGLYPVADHHSDESADRDKPIDLKQLYIKMCRFPWEQPVMTSQLDDQYVVSPCCYIPTTKLALLADNYDLCLDALKPADEIYNSPQLWRFREDLVDGNTRDVCGNCDAARGYLWKPKRH